MLEYPGYKRFEIKPLCGGTLTEAAATYESGYGTIRSAWRKETDGIAYQFTVPANTTAIVTLKADPSSADRLIERFPDAEWNSGEVVFSIGSGSYIVKV